MTKKELVLFDDDESLIEICIHWLERNGWTVHSFTRVDDVESRIRSIMPSLILMDLRLPGVGGEAAIKTLRSFPEFNHIPILLFSAMYGVESICHAIGADGFIAKPFDLHDMESRLVGMLPT